MSRLVRLAAGGLVLVFVLPAGVSTARRAGVSYRLRLDGYVGPAPEGRREMADLVLQAGEKNVEFQVTDATVLSGHILPSAVFSRVRPYRPNFMLRGPTDLVQQVEHAETGAKLRIVGLWRSSSRNLLLGSVEKRE